MPRAHTYVRLLSHLPGDIAMAQEAITSSANDFPDCAFQLATSRVMIAEHDGHPVLVQPFYTALVLGSLAWVGAPTDSEKAAAQHAMTAAAFTECHRSGLLNILTFSNTPETEAFAQRHGFRPPVHPVYVMEVR